jgi:DNA (cytosine-5)-methyltransferase 1
MPVPVIDLFAGPGGLGEGFSRAQSLRFDIAVSIEKDEHAFETLRLRAAYRALAKSGVADRATWAHWDSIILTASRQTVFERLQTCGSDVIESACRQAQTEAWRLEMGPGNRAEVSGGIRRRLRRYMDGRKLPDNCVLIGGPPCQAYSIVGRSRNRGTAGYRAEDDHRHFLYREYLHVISEFRPAVFVMENVKGILTSRVANVQMFSTILEDLRRPDIASGGEDRGLAYVLVPLSRPAQALFAEDPREFIVEAEQFGVPQARHRVIVCGVRKDVFERAGGVRHLRRHSAPSVGDVINDLPQVRSTLSRRGDGMEWHDSFRMPMFDQAIVELRSAEDPDCRRVAAAMKRARTELSRNGGPGPGADRLSAARLPVSLPRQLLNWYRDRQIGVLANHESRAHMPSDLVRYLFMACFGQETGASPKLAQFPSSLLPEHTNVDSSAVSSAPFKDRFRVQLANRFSMTVTSHIAKDGHAFIHPDPLQCRALTVREAARLQTFPDSYVFLGNRTAQFTQVGNAVPPYLAVQIAEIVGDVLISAGLSGDDATLSVGSRVAAA